MRHEIDPGTIVARIVEVERRRHDLIAQREDAENALDRARSAEQMPDRRLGRAHRQGADRVAEQAADGVQLEFVAQWRRSAMRIDIIDVGKLQAGLPHRHFHRPEGARPFGVRRGDVIGVTRQAIADQFGIDLGAPRLGAFIFLEHDDARALAHHEAVAVDIIGPARPFRRVVETGRQRARLRKAGDAERADRTLGAPRQHHIGIVHRDHAGGVADRMRAGRTGGDDGVVRPHQPVFDLHLARDQIDQPAVHEMRGNATRSLFVQDDRFACDSRQAADPGPDRAAGAEALLLGHVEQPGILERLTGGIDAIDDERIDLALHLVIDALAGIESIFMVRGLHLAGDAAGIIARIESSDRACTGFRREDILPRGFDIGAQRRD